MAATMATMSMLSTNSNKIPIPNKQIQKPFSLQNLPQGLSTAKAISTSTSSNSSLAPAAAAALAGVVFSTLSSCDAAFAAQQIAEIAEGDNRGLALLLPIIPAIAWVLFNILQPALNQINKMRTSKGVMIGLGLGGLTAAGMMASPEATAAEMATIAADAAAAAGTDNRGQLLLIVITPALLWVLYNILQPALNQLNKMRSD
ncbi:photosystem II core complex proteins psbY, chloroplastic [Impatiens glandulifera]|uniref:photosystem II core complex proteins psbY, chloroplastic n=1 Tax=Impatiens glandulifera TaxID=253017 RepID=UPI001FB05904|nr:photosystem II core complex proteins psbY, chloroplastic [Impatiens glandulifera]